MKQGGLYFSKKILRKYLPPCFFFLFFLNASVCFPQWKKLATFPYSTDLVYFQNAEGHSEVGFVGSELCSQCLPDPNDRAFLWKTTDYGQTWREVSDSRM